MNAIKIIQSTGIMVCLFAFIACSSGNKQRNQQKKEDSANPETKKVGMVIKIDSAKIDQYLALHSDSNPGVRDLLRKYHLRNFSIFMTQLDDGNYYEFGYYEYIGSDFEKEMVVFDSESRNKEWLKICDPMQIPLKGEKSWKIMEQIYYNK